MPRALALLPHCLRLVAAAVILVIAAHAFQPVGEPLERGAGSAFSAATLDVSLGCGDAAPATCRIAPIIAAPLTTPTISLSALLAGITLASRWPADRSTGPPPRRAASSPLAPRAPPAA